MITWRSGDTPARGVAFGELHTQLRERHDASDFETRTQDKLEPAEE